MARFYARFDGGTVSDLDSIIDTSSFFDRFKVADGSTNATNLRNGLIASRSALTNDVYEDLDFANRNGQLGTYFPPDSGPFSTNGSTFLSWSTAYTSSVNGIKIPTANEYDSDGVVINYSLRPTASVLSTYTTLVGPTNPTDPVGVSYTTYVNATTAVSTVLNSIRSGSDTTTNRGPLSRLGNYPGRTLHSVWHDPDLQYFAWDDFTPGQPRGFTTFDSGSINDEFWYTNPISFKLKWSGSSDTPGYEYKADELARPVVEITFHATGSSTPIDSLSPTLLTAGTYEYSWAMDADPGNGEYELDASVKLRDSKLYGQGFNSDGATASVTNANLIKLTRLYPYDLAATGSRPSPDNCFDYGALSTYYATVPEPLSLVGERVYLNTDAGSVSGAPTNTYYYDGTSSGPVYTTDAAGAPFASAGNCSGGGQGTTTTTTSTTSTTTIPDT